MTLRDVVWFTIGMALVLLGLLWEIAYWNMDNEKILNLGLVIGATFISFGVASMLNAAVFTEARK